MSKTIAEALEEQGGLREARAAVRLVLEARFGTLPDDVRRAIDSLDDFDRLHAATQQAALVKELDQFKP